MGETVAVMVGMYLDGDDRGNFTFPFLKTYQAWHQYVLPSAPFFH